MSEARSGFKLFYLKEQKEKAHLLVAEEKVSLALQH
jgi:hypothetical protein